MKDCSLRREFEVVAHDHYDELKRESALPDCVLMRIAEEQAAYLATHEWECDVDRLTRLMEELNRG